MSIDGGHTITEPLRYRYDYLIELEAKIEAHLQDVIKYARLEFAEELIKRIGPNPDTEHSWVVEQIREMLGGSR